MRVPLASSGLRTEDIELINKVLISGNLTMGARVKEFEAKMSKYLGCKHFIMVNSGSSANLLMLEALLRPTKNAPLLSPGDSILVPAIAWPTTIWPLVQLGLNPLFVDVDANTLALDLKLAQKLIDETRIPVKGIFPIHPLGLGISHLELESFAHQNNLILINDVCESLGSWQNGRHSGVSGKAASFSFYFSHHITTMEGGGIATDDDLLADDIRSMRSHGWSRDRSDAEDWTKEKSPNDSKFLFVSTGYNVRPMEIQAVVGSSQIDSIDGFVEKRRAIARRVLQAIPERRAEIIGSKYLTDEDLASQHSWMLIPIRVLGKNSFARKKKVVEYLNQVGVETRPVLTGNFLAQPAIQRITRHAVDPKTFQVASQVSEDCFMVGAHHDLSTEQVQHLEKSIIQAFESC